jgi:long-chain acyl-CoA synthetase
MSFNLATMLQESARARPEHLVCRTSGRDVSYRELDEDSGRCAAALLACGCKPGDRIAVQLPNIPEFLVAYFGILKAGLVMVPINPVLTEHEYANMIADSGAVLHLNEPAQIARLVRAAQAPVEAAQTAAEDTAVIVYTSGTTGRPKGAELSHIQLYLGATISGEAFGVREDDVTLAVLPLFHVYGLSSSINTAVRFGTTVSLVRRFEPEQVLDVMARHGVSVALGVPTMYHALLGADLAGRDLGRFRIASCGGASMPEALMNAFEQRFGVRVVEGFGMSETGACGLMNTPDDRRVGSVGRPIWGVQARVDAVGTGPEHVGELQLKGHVVMKGYHEDPEATAATVVDGWLRTGDLAYVDEDGFYYIVDRSKDLIIRGGYNVYPREVEEVLHRHPGVLEAAVIGRPDERLGEEVVAVLVARPGSALDAGGVLEFCRASLAPYKCPRELRFVDALPKNAAGKILKRELR